MENKREIIGQGEYAVGEHQQFVDKSGQLVRVVRGSSEPVPVGKAYGFFDCSASKEAIEAEIPNIRSESQTPSNLELSLIEGVLNLKGDEKLMALAREAQEAGNKYVFEATYTGATNRKTVDEVADVLNQMYQSPLYKQGESFSGAIVYEENGQYQFRD